MVAIVVASIVCLLAGPYLYRLYRRERRGVRRKSTMVLVARLTSLKINRAGRPLDRSVNPHGDRMGRPPAAATSSG
jgi:hypothetical protein